MYTIILALAMLGYNIAVPPQHCNLAHNSSHHAHHGWHRHPHATIAAAFHVGEDHAISHPEITLPTTVIVGKAPSGVLYDCGQWRELATGSGSVRECRVTK